MEWINRLASLFCVFSSAIWNQFIDHLSGHDFHHLLGDLAHLLVLGVRGLPNLIVALFSKTHTEQTKQVTIGSLDVNVSFNHGLPFFDHGAHFVTGKIHTMKISQAVFALNILSN